MIEELHERLQGLVRQGSKRTEEVNDLLSRRFFPDRSIIYCGSVFSPTLRGRWIVADSEIDLTHSAAMVSSRISRDLENQPAWFNHLRAAILAAKKDNRPLITCKQTTCDRFLYRARILFDVAVHEIQLPGSEPLSDWLEQLNKRYLLGTIFVSPGTGDGLTRDEIMLALAQRVYTIQIDSCGQTIRRVLAELSAKPRTVLCPNHSSLVKGSIQQMLIDNGATQWHLMERKDQADSPLEPSKSVCDIIPLSKWGADEEFLFHCTRRRTGAWPGQDEDSFLDEVLLSRASDRSPLSSLIRIVEQQRIMANSRLNRNESSVVSFTSHSLRAIKQMRVFRPHLSRWDFEHYGIGIAKAVLQADLNIEPVIYGDDSVFEELPSSEKHLFQRAFSKSATGSVTDWRLENEWRVKGDVCLDLFGEHEIVLFVRTRLDAMKLRTTTDRPIVVLYE